MFQTPQMREGGGIMAGVAPIRGYADGDLVEEDDSMIASLLSQAELPEFLSNLTMDDAVSYVKQNPEILIYGLPGVGIGGAAALKFGPGLARGAVSLARRLISKKNTGKSSRQMTEGDIAPPPSGQRTMTPGDIGTTMAPRASTPASGRVARAKDAVSSATSRVISPIRATGRGLKTVGKVGAGAAGTAAAVDLTTGSDYLSTGLSAALDAALKAGRITKDQYDQFMATPEISALSNLLSGPENPEDADLPPPEAPPPEAPPPPPPDPTFLDMLKGAGTQFKDFLQDPANQYALARASQPREGIAPMNFASDFAVGKEEYKQLEAQRENDTALMRNYQFLKETTDLSDKEIVSRLSNEATARDEFLTLFSEAVDTAGSVTPEQIAQFEAITGYTLPEEARVRLGVAAAPSDDID